jgi:hypothetical protein
MILKILIILEILEILIILDHKITIETINFHHFKMEEDQKLVILIWVNLHLKEQNKFLIIFLKICKFFN